MNEISPRPKRWPMFLRLAVVLIVAGAGAGVLVVKSQRAAYVRETLAILPAAEKAYAEGRFGEAALTAGGALTRCEANRAWFSAEDEEKVLELNRFLIGQVSLWGRVEAATSTVLADPAKARAELDSLMTEALRSARRAQPLIGRLETHLKDALDRERETVLASAAKRIPEAREAFEQGSWDLLLTRLEEIHASVGALPEATRDAAARKLEPDLEPIEAMAAPVAVMQAIRTSQDEGPVKADRLREVISTLADLKGRDASLHRALRKAIAEVDPETRKAPVGVKLPKQAYDGFVEALVKDSGLERIGKPDDTSVVELQGPANRYAIRIAGRPPQIQIEVDRVRLNFPIALVDNREALSLQAAAELSRALRATRHARVFADESWAVRAEAPGLCAFNTQGKQACVFLGGRIYEGPVEADPDAKTLVNAFVTAARGLEQSVRDSASVPDEIKGPVTALLKATHEGSSKADHLDARFCREAVHEGYVEAQLPKVDEEIAATLKEYRRTYGELSKLRTRFEAKAADGASATLLVSLDNDVLWRVIDPAANTTTFSSVPRDGMGSGLAAVSVFAGAHPDFPEDAEPLEVRMVHGSAGVISRWTAESGKLEFDAARWSKAVSLGEAGSIPEHYGSGDWQVPPHALKVGPRGQARELILPKGALKVDSFSGVAAGPARREAQDRFLQRCSEVLHTPGEYHLLFRYFVQYVLDSPVTTATTLIGSSRHCGDAHQDAYQTLDRRLNGKLLSDCDDLAELYWTILRRQNRPAFVLGVPGHATCGVAEKDGEGWSFFCVDTGPARQLKGPDLDGIVERLLRTYDDDGDMAFDPRQMRFLFRFAGEQTRSDYYLDSRILRDPTYADLMIQVQEYWHFGFYALGIETMSKVLETDRMPANCQEIAGLYTRVGLWEDALKWTEAGIKGLEAKDQFTGLNDVMRVVNCLRELKRKDEATRSLKSTAESINKVLAANPGEAERYRNLRFTVAMQLAESDLPWEGWAIVGDDVKALMDAGVAAEFLCRALGKIFLEMNEIVRAGTALTEKQKLEMMRVSQVLETIYRTRLFKDDDSSMDVARKYGEYFLHRVCELGLEKATAELVKPELPKEERRPDFKKNAADALDWPWIRLSPVAYFAAARAALVLEDPGAGGPKVAIEVARALEKALPEIRRQGSLGTLEFSVLDLRLLRACLEMDEKGIRAVFDEMKRQGWGRLYEDLSRTLGAAAEFMKVEDFEKIFRIYCEYNVPRRHYYGVVYAASEADRRGHALAASKICIERFPDDADMRREHALLQKLSK